MDEKSPPWLPALGPIRFHFTPIRPGSNLSVWQADIALEAWQPPPGCILSGSDTWNGKALLRPLHSGLERSVGEVEVVERLRLAFPEDLVYWTAGSGNPPEIWRPWALRAPLRGPWFTSMEADIRRGVSILEGNRRGTPDVLGRRGHSGRLYAVEYKGPSPSNPRKMDEVSEHQEAWVRRAFFTGVLDENRFAVVSWSPSPADVARLREQAAASRLGREQQPSSHRQLP